MHKQYVEDCLFKSKKYTRFYKWNDVGGGGDFDRARYRGQHALFW